MGWLNTTLWTAFRIGCVHTTGRAPIPDHDAGSQVFSLVLLIALADGSVNTAVVTSLCLSLLQLLYAMNTEKVRAVELSEQSPTTACTRAHDEN
eukprot:1046425-Rhodomonas_salina.3